MVDFRKGDQLLLLDSSWYYTKDFYTILDRAVKNEVKSYAIIHDLGVFEHQFHKSQDKATFSNLMIQDDGWWHKKRSLLSQRIFHFSNDYNSMLCLNSFRWASGQVDEIIDF